MNAETTRQTCESGAWHVEPYRTRACVAVGAVAFCGACVALLAAALDAEDAGFRLVAADAGERDDYGEMMCNTGHEVQDE